MQQKFKLIRKTNHRLGEGFAKHLHSVHQGMLDPLAGMLDPLVAIDFNFPFHSDVLVLDLRHCQSEAKHKAEEQNLIFCLACLQLNNMNILGN